MDLLARIEEEITTLRRSGALTAGFRMCKERGDGLRSFDEVETLIAFLRDSKAGPPQRKDAALAALCMEASSGDQRVATLLIWLLLPGLLRLRHDLAGGAMAAQDLEAELVTGVWEAAVDVHPDSRKVAARLVNRARWRAIAAMREAIDWAGRFQQLGAEAADVPEPEVEPTVLREILTEAVWEGVVSSAEVELILASRFTLREVGDRLGLTFCAAQQRRGRAKRRLLAWVAESSRIPPQSLAPRSPWELPENTPGSLVQERPSAPPL
jgi:hypothetical protein